VQSIVSRNAVALAGKASRHPSQVVVYTRTGITSAQARAGWQAAQIFHAPSTTDPHRRPTVLIGEVYAQAKHRPAAYCIIRYYVGGTGACWAPRIYASHPLFPLSKHGGGFDKDVMNVYGETLTWTVPRPVHVHPGRREPAAGAKRAGD